LVIAEMIIRQSFEATPNVSDSNDLETADHELHSECEQSVKYNYCSHSFSQSAWDNTLALDPATNCRNGAMNPFQLINLR
jgi:hypothetical protein